MQGAADTRAFSILQSELQRNYDVLAKQDAPAYFMSYTMHDTRTARLAASVGALQQSDEARSRFVTVEVRVGDYSLDNTHPIRGDARSAGPRVTNVALPLTDEEKPIRLALWHATDRTFKQASEGLTRVKTNVAAKIKEEDPAPDFSHEEVQKYMGEPATYSLDTKAWEARLRRISAPFGEDPLVFRSDVSLSVDLDNRFYVNSEGTEVATGDVACRLFIEAVTKADDGMELPLYASYFATSPAGLPDEKELIADVRSMICSRGCGRRRSSIRSPAPRSCRAAPRASSSTRSSATASRPTASGTRTTARRSPAKWASPCCRRSSACTRIPR
jgi:TldD protein